MFEGNAISGTVDFARISPWQKYNWANGKIIFFWWTCKAILFSEKRMSSSKLTQNQSHLKCWNTVHAFWDKCSMFKSCGIWKIIVRGNEAFPEEASYKPRNSGKALLTSSKPSSQGFLDLGKDWIGQSKSVCNGSFCNCVFTVSVWNCCIFLNNLTWCGKKTEISCYIKSGFLNLPLSVWETTFIPWLH